MLWLPALLMMAFAAGAHAQATAQTSVAPDLRECYTDPLLLNRNNLPPANINVLIDIIRQIEDDPNVNVDLRTLAALLLHIYRQDGIQYHQRDANVAVSANVLPFSPTFHSFHRHRLLLRLIPSNLQTLPNNTISAPLKCALHHMLSTTVDSRVRGDENNCGQLSQYRAMRTLRLARSVDDDVETLDLSKMGADKNGRIQLSPDSEVEYNPGFGSRFARQLTGGSTCPILTGVINTRWGAVSAGNLIAGIAAGAEAQQVNILELTKGSVLNYQNVQSTITTIYPATLSGDLAEAVLIQGTRGSSSISVGSAGNWNSSQATKFFMLSNQLNIEMSDPEIRGGVDGFVLGSTLTQTLGTASTLRLSQLLDMYYAPRNGVFNPALRACNRRELSQQNVVSTVLAGETGAFAAALDSVMPLEGTLTGGLDGLVNSAVNNFQTYMTNNMNDLNCAVTDNISNEDSRYKINLVIALDASWPYNSIYPAISYLLDSIEVSKFGSSVTLVSAFDGSIIINQTNSLAEFHSNYTLTRHQTLLTGVNLEVSLSAIRSMMQNRLRNESAANYIGGNSTILLYLLNSGTIENNGNVWEQGRQLNENVPDLRVFFGTAINQVDNLGNLVRDPLNDIVTINLNTAGTNVDNAMFPLLSRFQLVGRRIINPLCGADFGGGSSGTRQFDDNVEPGYINFYRISPNYFFSNNENTRIRIQRTGSTIGTLTVCHSRFVALPRSNGTFAGVDPSEITCQNLAATGNVEINLSGACDGQPNIGSCPALHISVQAVTTTGTTTAICTNVNVCRFPYNLMYQVQIQDLACFSSGTSIAASVLFVVLGLLFNIHRSI